MKSLIIFTLMLIVAFPATYLLHKLRENLNIGKSHSSIATFVGGFLTGYFFSKLFSFDSPIILGLVLGSYFLFYTKSSEISSLRYYWLIGLVTLIVTNWIF